MSTQEKSAILVGMLSITSQHFNEILRYPISGKDWLVRVALQGAVLMLLCPFLVGIPLLTGLMVAHTKRGIDGSNDYPNWEWGTYWNLGWKAIAVNFLYYLPILALIGIYLITIVLPLFIAAVTKTPEVATVSGMFGMMGMMIIYPMLFLYAIFYAAVQMAVSPKLAAGASLNATLQFKGYIWPYLKANVLNMLLVYLIGYLASLVASLGVLFMFIGVFLTMPFGIALMAYGNGVIYRLSTVK